MYYTFVIYNFVIYQFNFKLPLYRVQRSASAGGSSRGDGVEWCPQECWNDLLHNGSDDGHHVHEHRKEDETCEENDVERGSHFVLTEVEVAAIFDRGVHIGHQGDRGIIGRRCVWRLVVNRSWIQSWKRPV